MSVSMKKRLKKIVAEEVAKLTGATPDYQIPGISEASENDPHSRSSQNKRLKFRRRGNEKQKS